VKNIKGLNIRAMQVLVAMVENNFIVGNAAIDLNVPSCEITAQIKRIDSYFKYDIFDRKPLSFTGKRLLLVGLTKEGYSLHSACKVFLDSLNRIEEQ